VNPKDLMSAVNLMEKLKPTIELMRMQPLQTFIEEANRTQNLLKNLVPGNLLRQESLIADLAKQMQPFGEQLRLTQNRFDETAQLISQSVKLAQPGFADSLDLIQNVHSVAQDMLASFQSLQEVLIDRNTLIIGKSFSQLLDRYSDLYSLSEAMIRLPEIPEALIGFPPVELFNSSRLIHSLHIGFDDDGSDSPGAMSSEPQEPDDSFIGLLAQFDPRFVAVWKGARESAISDNPDRVRHTATSLRELVRHLIEQIAPDDQVKQWTKDPEHYYNEGLTRGARLDYICRSITTKAFSAFLVKDMKLLAEFFNLYNKGTHELPSRMDANELNFFLIKTESSIRFLIQIWRLSNNN